MGEDISSHECVARRVGSYMRLVPREQAVVFESVPGKKVLVFMVQEAQGPNFVVYDECMEIGLNWYDSYYSRA